MSGEAGGTTGCVHTDCSLCLLRLCSDGLHVYRQHVTHEHDHRITSAHADWRLRMEEWRTAIQRCLIITLVWRLPMK
jgi:hypothetical protein